MLLIGFDPLPWLLVVWSDLGCLVGLICLFVCFMEGGIVTIIWRNVTGIVTLRKNRNNMTTEQEKLFELIGKWRDQEQVARERAKDFFKMAIEYEQDANTLRNCADSLRDIIYPKEEREKDEKM